MYEEEKSNNVVRHPIHNAATPASLRAPRLWHKQWAGSSVKLFFYYSSFHFCRREKEEKITKSFLILFVFRVFFSVLSSAYHECAYGNEGTRERQKMEKNHRFLPTFVFEFLVFKGNTLRFCSIHFFFLVKRISIAELSWKVTQQLITQWNFYGFRMFVVFVPMNLSQLCKIWANTTR